MQTHRRIIHWIGKNWARLSYSRFVEPFWLQVNKLDLDIPDLASPLDGFRVLQLTDFHYSGRMPATHIRRSVEIGNQQGCDVIALTGDFIHSGYRHISAVMEMLSRLRARHGVFAVLGNHDYSVRNKLGLRRFPQLAAKVAKSLEDVGIKVLHNEHVILDHDGAKIVLAGVADLWSRESDLPKALDGVPEDLPRIVLAHNPSEIHELGGRRCDLMLSGHTHGGQVHLPGNHKPVFAAGLTAGLYCHDSGYLYVNRGVGYTVRFRFNVRPEIAVFTLRSDKLGRECAT